MEVDANDSDRSNGEESHSLRTRAGKDYSRRTFIVAVIATLVLAIAANLPYSYVSIARTGSIDSRFDFEFVERDPPVMAGWPCRYLILPGQEDGVGVTSIVSVVALLINLFAFFAVGATVAIYFTKRETRIGRNAKQRFTLADLLLLTSAIAAGLGGWNHLQNQRRAMSATMKQSGERVSLYASAWVPRFFASLVPPRTLIPFRRIRGIQVQRPDGDLVRRLAAHKHLVAFRVGGGEYDAALLGPLQHRPHLRDLRIAGRVIDDRTMDLISSCKRLQTLSLVKTNVTSEAIKNLSSLKSLRRLDVTETDVQLGDVRPPWADTITHLRIPHPEPDGSATLSMVGWPRVKRLTIDDWDSPHCESPMDITLSELPELSELRLDSFQKFKLRLLDLPNLTTITPLDQSRDFRIRQGSILATDVWVDSLEVTNAPKLQQIHFSAKDLRRLRIDSNLNRGPLKVSGSYQTAKSVTSDGQVIHHPLSPRSAKVLLKSLTAIPDLKALDLSGTRLDEVDLSLLAKCDDLEQLDLSYTWTKFGQLKKIPSFPSLRRLRFRQNPIDLLTVLLLLEKSPKLERLEFGGLALRRTGNELQQFSILHLVGHEHLQELSLDQLSNHYLRSVRIVDMPALSSEFNLRGCAEIVISGSPCVKGFSHEGRLPPRAKFSDLRDLQYFAVGGPEVDDAVVASIKKCTGLRQLTLAFAPQITDRGFAGLPTSNLTTLYLPYCELTDAAVATWDPLQNLTELDLRSTKITAASIPKLLASPKLKKLWLDGCEIKPAELAEVGRLKNLTHLSLAGIGVDPPSLQRILKGKKLLSLDLSGMKITDEVISELIQAPDSLVELSLRGCEMNDVQLDKLIRKTTMKLDLTDVAYGSKAGELLFNGDRLFDAVQVERQLRYSRPRIAFRAKAPNGQSESPSGARINLSLLAPAANGAITPVVRRFLTEYDFNTPVSSRSVDAFSETSEAGSNE